jgi:hypothetical protein
MVGSYTLSSRSLDGLPLACGANVHASICRRDLWYFADPWGSGSTFCAWTGTAAFFFVGSGPEPGFICKRRTAFSDSRPAATNRRGPNCASRPGRTVPVLTSTCSPVATQGSGRRRGGQTAHSGRTGLFPGRFIPRPPQGALDRSPHVATQALTRGAPDARRRRQSSPPPPPRPRA